jgi:hypothetical protein
LKRREQAAVEEEERRKNRFKRSLKSEGGTKN